MSSGQSRPEASTGSAAMEMAYRGKGPFMSRADVEYYNTEWSIAERSYANVLQLTRAIAILTALSEAGISNPKICELGSGTGWLASMLGSIGDTLGVELSDVAVRRARERYAHVAFECADVLNWNYPRERFDVAISHEVIEHVADQRRYVDVAYEILKPGGLFVLTTPNARTVQAMPPEMRSNQPREDVLTHAQLSALVRERFANVRVRSILLRGGQRGIYRVVHSERLQGMLATVGLRGAFVNFALRANFGLHLIATAQKRSD